MDPITFVCAALLLVLLFVLWRIRRRSGAAADAARADADRLDTVAAWPPTATRILTTAERHAYKTLTRGLPEYMILAKVPLARFLNVPSRQSYAEWLRRLGYQCADLVVCDMASEVVAVVSLRSATGERSARAQKRHKRLARVLKAARIPLHEWTDGALPTPENARELLLPAAPESEASRPPSTPKASRPGPLDFIDDEDASHHGPGGEPPPSTWFDDLGAEPESPRNPAKP